MKYQSPIVLQILTDEQIDSFLQELRREVKLDKAVEVELFRSIDTSTKSEHQDDSEFRLSENNDRTETYDYEEQSSQFSEMEASMLQVRSDTKANTNTMPQLS